MSKIEYHKCDIKGCDNNAKHINKQMQVIFLTEQEEGHFVDPYFSNEKIDMCESCFNKILKSKKYITVIGAMGFNDYKINE